jgi:hypothetical protein
LAEEILDHESSRLCLSNFLVHDDTNQPPPSWPPRLLQLSRQASLVGVLDVNQQKPLLPRSMIAGKYLVDIVWFCFKVRIETKLP